MHSVVVLALDGVIAFDLATPVEVFGHACGSTGQQLYEVSVAGPKRHVSAGVLGLSVPHGLDQFTRVVVATPELVRSTQ